MAILEGSGAQPVVTTEGEPIADIYLKTIKRSEPISQDPGTGAIFLTQYQIDSEMWANWAAAAGYPGAHWSDKAVVEKVAAWAAEALYEAFDGNWGLVAIGWRYGPAVATQIRDAYGSNPATAILNKMLDDGGSKFLEAVITQMAKVSVASPPLSPLSPPQSGEVTVDFVTEQPEEGEDFTSTFYGGPNPAHTALLTTLKNMADRMAEGDRWDESDPRLGTLDAPAQTAPEPIADADIERPGEV